jgi:predicted dehydrogenase
MVEKIRVGVVGVGALGQHHARVYARLPEVSLVGVVDTLPGRAQEIAGPLATRAFSDYRELLGKVDAVSVATPTTLHAGIGEQFLKEGVHVLMEKPISHSLEDADRLIRAAARSGRSLQIGHLERFNPVVRAVREFVKQPRFIEAHRMGLFSPRSLDIDVVLDLMIHDLDIITLLVPSPVQDVKAVGIPILTQRIDIANARLQFANGCVANVTASRVSMEKIRKLRLFHSRDYVSLDYARQQAAVFSLQPAPDGAAPQIVSRHIAPAQADPLQEEIRAFLQAARGEARVECTGEDGKKALGLALKILGQAQKAHAAEFDRR